MASIISQKNFKITLIISLLSLYSPYFLWLYRSQFDLYFINAFCMIYVLCFGVGILLIGNNLNYYRPKNFSYGYLLAWCLFFAWFCTFLPNWLISLFAKNKSPFSDYINQFVLVIFAINLLLLLCFAAFSLIWYSFEDIAENNRRKDEALSLNRDAELYKLRQQLQPHFLFNSLNSINALIGSKPTEARKMIEQLSDFLRYTIKKEDNQLVELKDELMHLQLYLEIEKVRFGHRLSTKFIIDQKTETLLIPALLLQPVLENAIKFGLYDTIEAVEIEIFSSIVDNDLHLKITNPFDATASANAKGTGFGLRSIKKRLQLLFYRTDLLKINKNENFFTTEITIPQPK
jgi:two-component system, LytTR family, sensor kinase